MTPPPENGPRQVPAQAPLEYLAEPSPDQTVNRVSGTMRRVLAIGFVGGSLAVLAGTVMVLLARTLPQLEPVATGGLIVMALGALLATASGLLAPILAVSEEVSCRIVRPPSPPRDPGT